MARCFQGDRLDAPVLFVLFHVVPLPVISHLSPQLFLLFLVSWCKGFCQSFHLQPPSLSSEHRAECHTLTDKSSRIKDSAAHVRFKGGKK